MKRIIALLTLLFFCVAAFPQKQNTADKTQGKVKPANDTVNKVSKEDRSPVRDNQDQDTVKVNKQPQETRYTTGNSGVRRSIHYKFSRSVNDADPGKGIFRYSSDTISGVKWIFAGNYDLSGEDQTNWYETWDDTTGATGRGSVNLVEFEGTNINEFNFTGVFIRGAGYWKFPVDNISGKLPAEGAEYYFIFNRIAHKKPQSVQQTQPQQVPGTVTEQKPVTEEKPVQVTEVVQPPQPAEEAKPVAEEKPVQITEVVQPPQPAEVPKPVAEEKPVQVTEVIQPPQPAEEAKPVAEQEPVQVTEVVQPPQPVQEVQPVTEPVVAEKPKLSDPEPAKPSQTTVNQAKPAVQPSQPAQNTQTTTARPPSPTTETTQSRPAVQTTRPVQQAQPAQQPQPKQNIQTTQNVQNRQVNQPPVYNQVSQVNKPADIPNPYANLTTTGTTVHRKCYRGIIEVGYGLGLGEYGISNFRFNFINGIMVGRSSSIGLGIGYRRYFTTTWQDRELYSPVSQVPVFIDLRTSFSTRKVTPYLALGLGGSASFIKDESDTTRTRQEGFYFCPSGGIWFNVSERFAVFAGLAFEMQHLEYILLSDNSHFKKNSSSLSLNIGIAF